MIINLNSSTRIIQDRANFTIQEKVRVKEVDTWVSKYYFSSLESALKIGFRLHLSGRKIVDVEQLESYIQNELSKLIAGLVIEGVRS